MNAKKLTLIIVMLISANTSSANLITFVTENMQVLHNNQLLAIDSVNAKLVEMVKENGKRTLQDVTIFPMFNTGTDLERDLLSKLWEMTSNGSSSTAVFLWDPLMKQRQNNLNFKNRKWRKVFNVFVINEMNVTEIETVVRSRALKSLWSVKALTVFVVVNNQSVVRKEVESFLMEASRNRMLNSVVFHLDIRSSMFTIFTYNPFKKRDNLQELPQDSTFTKVFYDKLNNMHLHPIRISQYEDIPRSFLTDDGVVHGLDGMILNVVVQRLNATYVINDVSLSLKDSKNYASFLELFNGTAEISFNRRMFLSSDYLDSSIDYIYPREIESIRLLVPKALPISQYMALLQPFEIHTWFMIVGTFFLYCFAWYFGRKHLLASTPLTLEDAFLKTYRIFLASPLTKKITSCSERYFIMSFILFSFVILSTYQTMLITFLMTPQYERDLTLADIISDPKFEIVVPKGYDWSRFIGEEQFLLRFKGSCVELTPVFGNLGFLIMSIGL